MTKITRKEGKSSHELQSENIPNMISMDYLSSGALSQLTKIFIANSGKMEIIKYSLYVQLPLSN